MQLNYKVFGEGEPVVILHGLFGMLDNWQSFAKDLAAEYMVYIIDQRDHGKSPRTDNFNYVALSADLAEFCEQQWLHEARFIGHSMGGKTLLQFAVDHADMIQQMVIVDMGIKAYPGGHEAIIDALLAVPVESISGRSAAEEILASRISDWGVRQFLLKNLTRRREGGYAWKMHLDLLAKEYPHILEGITYEHAMDVDVLFVRGSKSDYVTDDDIPTILSTYARAQVATVDDAGHWIHAEQPGALLALVNEYFSRR